MDGYNSYNPYANYVNNWDGNVHHLNYDDEFPSSGTEHPPNERPSNPRSHRVDLQAWEGEAHQAQGLVPCAFAAEDLPLISPTHSSLFHPDYHSHSAYPPFPAPHQSFQPCPSTYPKSHDLLIPQSTLQHSLDQAPGGFALPPQPHPHSVVPAYHPLEGSSFVPSYPPSAQAHFDGRFLTGPVEENSLNPSIPLQSFPAHEFVASSRLPRPPFYNDHLIPSNLGPSGPASPASPIHDILPPTLPLERFHPQRRISSSSPFQAAFAPDHTSSPVLLHIDKAKERELEHDRQQREEGVWRVIKKHGVTLDALHTRSNREEYSRTRGRTGAAETRAVTSYVIWLAAHRLEASDEFQRFYNLIKSRYRNGDAQQSAQRMRMDHIPPDNDTSETPQEDPGDEATIELERPLWEAVREHAQVLFRFEGRRDEYNALTEVDKVKYRRELKRTTDRETRARQRYEKLLNGNLTAASEKYRGYRRMYQGHHRGRDGTRQVYHEWRRAQLQR